MNLSARRRHETGRFSPHVARRTRFSHALALLALLFFLNGPYAAAAQGAKAPQYHPGLRTLGIWLPGLNMRLDAAVWYPSARPPKEFRLDGLTITASQNGREVPGRYPVLLVSHDTASSRLAVHDLAAALAGKGFVVVAPTHTADSVNDASGIFRASTLQQRPLHLLLALEAALATPELTPLIDESRIGLLGIGAGSATALQLMGLRPDPAGLAAYCREEPGVDPYCTPWARRHFPLLEQEFELLLSLQGPAAFTPSLTEYKKPETPLATETTASQSLAAGTPQETENAEEKVTAPASSPPAHITEERAIGAAALVTPGLVALFPPRELASLTVPVAVISAVDDEIYPATLNADRLYHSLPSGTRRLAAAGAGHYALQAPCQQSMREFFPAICGKTSPQDAEARQARDAFLADFFAETLNSPRRPPPEPENAAPKASAGAPAPTPAPGQNHTAESAAPQGQGNAGQARKQTGKRDAASRPQPPRRAAR